MFKLDRPDRKGNESPIDREFRKMFTFAELTPIFGTDRAKELAEEQARWEDKEDQKRQEEQISKERGTGRSDGEEAQKYATREDIDKILQGQADMKDTFTRALLAHDGIIELNDKEAATLYGVGTRTIRNWRNGEHVPTFTDGNGNDRPCWPKDGRAEAKEWHRLAAAYRTRNQRPTFTSYDDEKGVEDS